MNGWKRGFAGRMLIPDHPHTGSGPQDSAGCTRQGWGGGAQSKLQSCAKRPRARKLRHYHHTKKANTQFKKQLRVLILIITISPFAHQVFFVHWEKKVVFSEGMPL